MAIFLIDTTVLRSAGEKSTAIESIAARLALTTLLDNSSHRFVVPVGLKPEYKRHASSFSRKWLASAKARRKIDWDESSENASLAKCLKRGLSEQESAALAKDWHWIDSALRTGAIVVSQDLAVRRIIHNKIEDCPQVGDLAWTHPRCPGLMKQLVRGAVDTTQVRIGHQPLCEDLIQAVE